MKAIDVLEVGKIDWRKTNRRIGIKNAENILQVPNSSEIRDIPTSSLLTPNYSTELKDALQVIRYVCRYTLRSLYGFDLAS